MLLRFVYPLLQEMFLERNNLPHILFTLRTDLLTAVITIITLYLKKKH